MKSKTKRLVSSLLVAAMVGSLFSGTAMGSGRTAAKKLIEDSSPVVFYGTGAPDQTFSLTKDAKASASQATPSEVKLTVAEEKGVEQGTAAFTKESNLGEITIMPSEKATPSEATKVTLAVSDSPAIPTFESSIAFKKNALAVGQVSVEVGSTETVKFNEGVSITKIESPDNKSNFTAKQEDNGIAITGMKIAKDPIRLNVKDDKGVIGICDVTVTASSPETEFVFFKEKTRDLSLGDKDVSLELQADALFEGVAVESSNESVAAVVKNDTNKTVTVTPVSRGDAVIVATNAATGKSDTCKIHVTLSGNNQEKYFTESNLSLSVGQTKKLPLTASASSAIEKKEAVLESDSEDVVKISSDKSSDGITYVSGIKEGTAVFTVIYNDGTWDECYVDVRKEKLADLFDIPEVDNTMKVLKGVDGQQISLTPEAMSYIEDADEEDVVLETDAKILTVGFSSPDKESYENYITVYGEEVGTAEITLKAGNYYDTCTVVVERNIAAELEEALGDVDSWTEENAEDKADDIKTAAAAVAKLTEDIKGDKTIENMNAYVSNLDEDSKKTLENQFVAIEKLESLLPFMNKNVELKEVNMDKVPAAVKELKFKTIGLGLNANLNAASKTYAELKVAEPDANSLTGIKQSADALALDISLAINDGSGEKDNQQPKSMIQLTMEIPEALKDSPLVVYHSHNNKIDTFDAILNGDGTMTIYITALSTFVIDKKDVQMVDVLVENVKGGHVTAYSNTRSDTDAITKMFLPVGEKVSVPAGTVLSLSSQPFHSRSDGIEITSSDGSKKIANYVVLEDNITITGRFIPLSSDDTEDEDYAYYYVDLSPSYVADGKNYTGQFTVYKETEYNNVKVDASNFKLNDVYGDLGEADNLFTLDSNGALKANQTLENGFYSFEISFDYDGKTYNAESGDTNIWAELRVGVQNVSFDAYLGKTPNGRKYTYYVAEKRVPDSTSFGSVRSNVVAGMYGGYKADCWYDSMDFKTKLSDSMLIKEDTEAYVRFTKDGKVYDPTFTSLDPANNGNNNNNGNSSSSSSYSSGGSSAGSNKAARNNYALYGKWEKSGDVWKFKLNNGYYAKNQWGYINGRYYYFGENAAMMTGWIFVGGEWYYLASASEGIEGAMATGFITTGTSRFYLNASGAMMTGWQQIDGTWYYFNPISDGTKGSLVTNQQIGGYYVNGNGAWVQ